MISSVPAHERHVYARLVHTVDNHLSESLSELVGRHLAQLIIKTFRGGSISEKAAQRLLSHVVVKACDVARRDYALLELRSVLKGVDIVICDEPGWNMIIPALHQPAVQLENRLHNELEAAHEEFQSVCLRAESLGSDQFDRQELYGKAMVAAYVAARIYQQFSENHPHHPMRFDARAAHFLQLRNARGWVDKAGWPSSVINILHVESLIPLGWLIISGRALSPPYDLIEWVHQELRDSNEMILRQQFAYLCARGKPLHGHLGVIDFFIRDIAAHEPSQHGEPDSIPLDERTTDVARRQLESALQLWNHLCTGDRSLPGLQRIRSILAMVDRDLSQDSKDIAPRDVPLVDLSS